MDSSPTSPSDLAKLESTVLPILEAQATTQLKDEEEKLTDTLKSRRKLEVLPLSPDSPSSDDDRDLSEKNTKAVRCVYLMMMESLKASQSLQMIGLEYDRSPYGMKGFGGIKPSMSDTNLAEAGLFFYKSKNSYNFSGTTEGAVDLTSAKISDAEEQGDAPLNLEISRDGSTASVGRGITSLSLDTYTDASLEAIAASLEALSSPMVPGDGQYQVERERLEMEKLNQQRLAEELEWERQEIQRFREHEQLLVQKELEELQSMKQHILNQQEDERQAHLMMQKETYAQQQQQLEQIQRLQEQLRMQLEEQKLRQMYPASPRGPKAMQRSMSDPKPMSPTGEERATCGTQYGDTGKGSGGTPTGTQKKVKRTLPNPPSEDESTTSGQTATTTGSARRRMCRNSNMARAKILQDIDRELDLVERESSKLRKRQAELDEEEKEIDAKLRYLEMGINRRKDVLLIEREKRERAYLQSVAEDRDYMSDSEDSQQQQHIREEPTRGRGYVLLDDLQGTMSDSEGNGLGIRVVGGKEVPGSNGDIGAYVAKVLPGGAAEQTGKILEGKLI
ncbi:Protein piccolo [Liparis tanakae]|uniref:Protein piccolo n=1 Tax=Liparis tanakae TaxID=230148 RepID=A0A4Z2GSA2_9TELE|nr:Protein piccolo [Liparis tanakae]